MDANQATDTIDAEPPSATIAHDYSCEENRTTHEKLYSLLTSRNIAFTHMTHVAVRTSEQAAAVRGCLLSSGAKAMLLVV